MIIEDRFSSTGRITITSFAVPSTARQNRKKATLSWDKSFGIISFEPPSGRSVKKLKINKSLVKLRDRVKLKYAKIDEKENGRTLDRAERYHESVCHDFIFLFRVQP